MIHKWLLLVRLQLLGFFGINRLRYGGSRQEKRKMGFLAVGVVFVILVMISYSCMIAAGCAMIGMASVLPALMLAVSSVVTFIFTFMKCNGVLFGMKDYDMVMSLPVSSTAVIVSRLLSMYVMNFLFGCLVLVPSMVAYGVTVNGSAVSVFVMCVCLVLSPLLPMVLAMLLGAVITAVSVRFGHSNVLVILLSVAAILAILAGSMKLDQADDAQLISLAIAAEQTVRRIWIPAGWVAAALNEGSLLQFGLFLLTSVAGTALFVALLARFYTKINTAIFSHRAAASYKVGQMRCRGQLKALYLRELKHLVSCSIYLLNSCIMAVLLVAACAALLFVNPVQRVAEAGMGQYLDLIITAAPFAVALIAGMTSTTAVSMSVEGKYRWLLFSCPIRAMDIFHAKMAVNLTAMLPAVWISAALLIVSLNPGLAGAVWLFVIPTVFVLFSTVAGLFFDLKYPNYDWTSEYQAVKQSPGVLITMAAGLVCAVLPMVLLYAAANYAQLILAADAVLMLLLTGVMYGCLRRVRLFL